MNESTKRLMTGVLEAVAEGRSWLAFHEVQELARELLEYRRAEHADMEAILDPSTTAPVLRDDLQAALEAADALAEQAQHVALGASIAGMDVTDAAKHLDPLWRKYDEARAALSEGLK